MTPPPSILQDPRHLPQGAGGLFVPQGKKRPRPARWGRGRSLCSCFGGCCRARSGGSGRSDLGGSSLRRSSLAGDLRSSLRRCSLAGDLGCGLRRCSLACSLGGSAVLLGHGRGGSSLRLSGSRSSLRGRSSSRRRAAAGSHADSQDQSSNGNTNILEFHIENLLAFEKNSFAEGCTGETFPQKDILVRFRKKSSPFLTKILFTEEILHFCYNLSPKVKDF